MLVIKVELWPGGDPGKAELVGGATVVNDGTGTWDRGNYDIEFSGERDKLTDHTAIKRVRVEGFPRLELGAFELLRRAFAKLGEPNGV